MSSTPITSSPTDKAIAEATQPCANCSKEITKTATTDAEKSELYKWIAQAATCDECSRSFYDFCE